MENMGNKIGVIAIIVENMDSVVTVNGLLHKFSEYIIGRQGIPYRQKGINVISIVIDAPQEIINSLSGKLGMINGISSKVLTTK